MTKVVPQPEVWNGVYENESIDEAKDDEDESSSAVEEEAE
eukprot:CAMPEP_0194188392 /NCGR_PEP_ID=MMETSP0154-20130528/54849_1 /TAXON_ID=1049557 /ORGANISM="Thalassiothrix antarctica, Strain L6-D1" /LENGTH=39 /DNA_ID= /DNA_START= /DNA_END= /DNA_ORIENTATION=